MEESVIPGGVLAPHQARTELPTGGEQVDVVAADEVLSHADDRLRGIVGGRDVWGGMESRGGRSIGYTDRRVTDR
jgi:hypothetical protein